MRQLSKGYEERRRYRIGDFEYLLDDDDGTAWIEDGHSNAARIYTLPETVEIENRVFQITSVEAGGYGTEKDRTIEELFIPDCYEYLDEYSFGVAPVSKLHIGKGLRYFHPWCLKSATANISIVIHPQNNSLKMSEDGHCVLTKDGKELIALIHDLEAVTIPDGVERIRSCAMACNKYLKSIQLPSSLKIIDSEGMIENRKIERLIIPEGVARIGNQALCENDYLKTLDLPSTLQEVEYMFIMNDRNLEKIIIRSDGVVTATPYGDSWYKNLPLDSCHLVVPRNMIPEYKAHPYWGRFKHIDILDD